MNQTKNTDAFGGRYQIVREIGHGTMGTVYHAIDRYTGQNVALKAVNTASDKLIFGAQTEQHTTLKDSDMWLALAREFRALASLRHPHVISVLDYGFEDGKPYFTMELLENNQDIISAGRDLPLDEKLALVRQILQAMIYLHQSGIIHRDLKPANIQVVNGQVKILDFGLAIARNKNDQEKLSGTLAYMAPEVLAGGSVNEKSDLYALGMTILELIVGQYPFPIDNIAILIQQIVYDDIPLQSYLDDDRLIILLSKMLDKKPQNRFNSAREALNYCVSSQLMTAEPESEIIRESFLQSARFVGRESEMNQLVSALQALKNGKGSAWLVGGESGVGKTRLLDELRIQAMVDGILVLRGQTVEAGGTPYRLMHDPLRHVCLATKLSEEELLTVLPMIPDIAGLLLAQQSLQAASEAVPTQIRTAVRQKLSDVVEAIFRRQKQAILLILEDLQWLKESLTLVLALLSLSQQVPLMIVGSYRDDEHPELAETLAAMQPIKLGRLQRQQIEELAISMAGETIGKEPLIVNMLERETEGNVFFIVEVMRVLAERAGQFEHIAYQTMPIDIFSGGIHAVIQRRLSQLPQAMIDLLQVAALTGRQIDLKILAHHNHQQLDLERWLMQCNNAVVLEVNDEVWRFSHDKIRSALIQDMSDDDKEAIHFQIATTIAMLDKDAANPRYALIALHYEQAGQLAQALLTYEKAAENALRYYAIDNTEEYLENIHRLEWRLNDYERKQVASAEKLAHRYRLWGEVADASGDMDGSRKHYEQVLAKLIPTEYDVAMTISNIQVRRNSTTLSQSEEDLLFASERLLNIYLHQGNWEQSHRVTERQGALYFGLGRQNEWVETVAIEAWIHYFQGYFKESERLFRRIYKLGKEKKLNSLLIFGGTGLIMSAIRLNLNIEALQGRVNDLLAALLQISKPDEPLVSILLDGVLALANWRLGDTENARRYANSTLSHIENSENIRLIEFAGFVGTAEMLLNQGERETADDKLLTEIAQAIKSLHIFAQVYPLARPRAWIYQSRVNWLKGKPKRARRDLQVAINQAQQCNMPYDEGIAYLTLARQVEKNHPEYVAYLDMAIACFSRVNATEQLQRAEQMKAQKEN
jgi:tetratricopeptide (TPR) repeat protein